MDASYVFLPMSRVKLTNMSIQDNSFPSDRAVTYLEARNSEIHQAAEHVLQPAPTGMNLGWEIAER